MMEQESMSIEPPARLQSEQGDGTTTESSSNTKFYQKNSASELTRSIHSDSSNDNYDTKRLNIENEEEASYFKLMKDNKSFRLFIFSYFATMSGE